MITQTIGTHRIQKHIIDVLMFQEAARFRDLRPPKVDTNLFSYHLKLLVKAHVVKKIDGGYTLDAGGLAYVDRLGSTNLGVQAQPKVITMYVVQNSDGDVLLWRRQHQPFIGVWTLPYGKLHIDDESLATAAQREIGDKLAIHDDQPARHVGDAYIRVKSDGERISTTLAHIFRFERDDIKTDDNLLWVRPHKLGQYKLAPAVEAIVARSFFNDAFFFEEFDVTW